MDFTYILLLNLKFLLVVASRYRTFCLSQLSDYPVKDGQEASVRPIEGVEVLVG